MAIKINLSLMVICNPIHEKKKKYRHHFTNNQDLEFDAEEEIVRPEVGVDSGIGDLSQLVLTQKP